MLQLMSMKDELDRPKSRAIGRYIYLEGRNGVRVHATKRSNAVVAKDGRPHSVARELFQDATMRSGGLPESTEHVHATCAGDTTKTEDKQCLQRDVTGSRCLEEGCGKNMLDDC